MEHWKEVNSPGQGVTPARLSLDPLATEGEATPGPDDVNPYDEMEDREEQTRATLSDISRQRDPTAGDDPFVFDDVEDSVDELQLPFSDSDSGPSFGFDLGLDW